jgi:hypothetical protein
MSTTQSSASASPRLRIGLGTGLIAVGALIAVAVTVVILALTGTSRTPSTIPATHPSLTQSDAAGAPPATRYLGTAQVRPDDTAARPVTSNLATAWHANCVYVRVDHRCFPLP